jgi:glycogen operon protein
MPREPGDAQIAEPFPMSAAEPLGVTLAGDGVNVAVVSTAAEAIAFCLFDGATERRFPLTERTGDVWHGHVPGVAAGAAYGLRARGPWDPGRGHRFNPAKLLIDPHATALDRVCRLHPAMFGHRADDPAAPDGTDSAPFVPRAVVGAPAETPTVARPDTPWSDTILYELHVRGFTMRHPEVPEALRGTFAGLAHPAAVAHLVALGVTAVELLPTMAWVEERHLAALGLTNYWGYNPIALCAPDPRLAPGGWAEIRAAVAALAAAGIETILDVVLNHTGEGDALGPTLSLRGLDNAQYYRLRDGGGYVDDTGCGNTLAFDRPHGARLAMDALRAWARFGGVHGFRFDLGTTLGRRDNGFDPAAPLLTAISQDPILRELKLISEPWDVGWGGYQLGRFPGGWGEWNDRFRDDTRRFWRGDGGLGALATRLAGSADVLAAHRRPSRGINFVVAHDGFTLADLVSHARKHNEANGEGNRDGSDDNASWNNGVEGASADPAVRAARHADQAALLATLLFARGTPMLAMGSEMGHSQGGNNNAYAQDSAIAWLDWGAIDTDLLARARAMIAARRRLPALRHDRFLTGAGDPPDVAWHRADGAAMTPDDWNAPGAGTLVAVFAAGGGRVAVALHRGHAPAPVTLPPPTRDGRSWRAVIGATPLPPRSVALFEEI